MRWNQSEKKRSENFKKKESGTCCVYKEKRKKKKTFPRQQQQQQAARRCSPSPPPLFRESPYYGKNGDLIPSAAAAALAAAAAPFATATCGSSLSPLSTTGARPSPHLPTTSPAAVSPVASARSWDRPSAETLSSTPRTQSPATNALAKLVSCRGLELRDPGEKAVTAPLARATQESIRVASRKAGSQASRLARARETRMLSGRGRSADAP